MKRLLFAVLLLIASNAYGWDAGGWNSGKISAGLIGSGFTGSGATDMASGSTTMPLNYSLVKKTYSNTVSETGTLANGAQGQIIHIVIDCSNGSGSYTLTPAIATGFSSVSINALGDSVTLLFLDNTNGWVIIGSSGATINQ